MSSTHSAGTNPLDPEEIFYVKTYRRLVGIMAALTILGIPATWIAYRGGLAATFAVGGLVGILNFYWLKRTVEAMGGRFPGKTRSPAGAVIRFILRYVLITGIAYVIVKSTASNLYGFFSGLSIPVGAILIEAVYETYRALRTRF